jgi:hypothetical protein
MRQPVAVAYVAVAHADLSRQWSAVPYHVAHAHAHDA